MAIPTTYIGAIREEISGSTFGGKEMALKRWSKLTGLSKTQIRRIITDGPKSHIHSLGDCVSHDPRYVEWTHVVFAVKKRPPQEAGEISTDQAVRIAVKARQIPDEALSIPRSTYDRIAREFGLTKKEKRIVRFQAGRPNQAHHFDASTSKLFYVARKSGDDYVLKLHRPAQHYKNKPIPCDRMRPWLYGLTDDYSGYHLARYTIAQGESAAESVLFLEYAWKKIGIPQKLFSDQGMLKKCLATADLIERLQVDLPQMMPYAKEGHGKIERPWRTCWQRFETPFMALDDWEKYEVSAEELNRMFINYQLEYNQNRHRFEKEITREQAWRKINLYGGMIPLPEQALSTAARSIKRVVNADGTFSVDGVTYEAKGLHAAEVRVFMGVFEDRVVVQDVNTGIKYDASVFAPLPLDTFRASKETPHQTLVKEGRELKIDALLYDDRPAAVTSEKIVQMPTRVQEERPLDSPFDVDVYPSLQEARREIQEIVGAFIPPDQWQQIEQLVADHGMKKDYVRGLGMKLFEAAHKRQAM